MEPRQGTITHQALDLETLTPEWRRYYERLIEEIRSGGEHPRGRFWTIDELKRIADERQDWTPRSG